MTPNRSYRPPFQPDELALQRLLNALRRNGIPFDEVIARLDAQNLPPQLVQSPHLAVLQFTGVPVLLLPKNPNRQSFIVANSSGVQLAISYDAPLIMPIAGGGILGVPLSINSFYSESNGSISINDIFVGSNSTSAKFTASITGTVMTVTATASGALAVNQGISGAGVAPGTTIVSFGTGAGGNGTYNLNISQNVGGESMTSLLAYVLGYEGALAVTGNPPPGQRSAQW